jgi:hypothetical protein
MALLGIPTVLYMSDFIVYPPSMNYFARDRAEFFRKIEEALADGWNFERIREAYRWHAFELKTSVIDISESFHATTHRAPLYRRLIDKVMGWLIPQYQQRMDCFRRVRKLRAQPAINQLIQEGLGYPVDLEGFVPASLASLAEETQAIQAELRRILRVMYGEETGREAGKGHLKARLSQAAMSERAPRTEASP